VKKVLIVEDISEMRDLLIMQMQRMGFSVVSASSGTEGVEKALTETPDLILMDIMLPNMDGWETTRTLRANPQTKDIPILVVTALSTDAEINACVEAGCNYYLTKPFKMKELREKVNELITRGP
jgi:two-component system, cell cycle response regulator DivK